MTVFLESCGEISLINYIDLSDDQKSKILAMRNHPEIKKWMYTQEDITPESHLAFIEHLKNDRTKLYLLVLFKGQTIGTINFKEIDRDKRAAEFALFSNPFSPLPGAGRILEEAAIRYGTDSLGLRTLTLEVFTDNRQVINLHKKYGFFTVGSKLVNNREVLCMRKEI